MMMMKFIKGENMVSVEEILSYFGYEITPQNKKSVIKQLENEGFQRYTPQKKGMKRIPHFSVDLVKTKEEADRKELKGEKDAKEKGQNYIVIRPLTVDDVKTNYFYITMKGLLSRIILTRISGKGLPYKGLDLKICGIDRYENNNFFEPRLTEREKSFLWERLRNYILTDSEVKRLPLYSEEIDKIFYTYEKKREFDDGFEDRLKKENEEHDRILSTMFSVLPMKNNETIIEYKERYDKEMEITNRKRVDRMKEDDEKKRYEEKEDEKPKFELAYRMETNYNNFLERRKEREKMLKHIHSRDISKGAILEYIMSNDVYDEDCPNMTKSQLIEHLESKLPKVELETVE